MSALTKISFKLLGFLKAKTGGSLKILHNYGCFCMVVQCLRAMLDKLLSAGWYMMTKGTLLFVFFSDSNHHFFRNACTKSGTLRFHSFPVVD
jgi:hypothetical protein